MASATALSASVLLLSLFFIFPALDATADAGGALNDVKALIELKRSITSDPLSIVANWDDATAPNACNWTGISCSTKYPGRVVQIALHNCTMRGSLSPHVANISYLQVLDLSANFFSGRIPPSLGRLGRLRSLNLRSNEFQGQIPHRIGNISLLQILYLRSNSLSGEIPESLVALRGLMELDVSQNQLTGQIPSWLGVFPSLRVLDIAENRIHGVIPVQLGNLSGIQSLSISANYLIGFIPCSLGRLYRLEEIHLGQNNLIGTIPHCLSNLTALSIIEFYKNNLQGHLPTWIGNFQKLQTLRLFYNNFTGTIPESFGNLTQLRALKLSKNSLEGTLPSSWINRLCSQLQELGFSSNYFTSGVSSRRQPIPFLEALSNCSRLTWLGLHLNRLTGTLPPNFGSSWPDLQKLYLGGNFISGNIPKSMANLSSVYVAGLEDNLFSGTIPSQIWNMRSLQGLYLSRNKLRGKIPAEISLLNRSLGYLHLSGNELSGSIPVSIGELVSLCELHLDGNLLSGKIPSEIGNCIVLQDLVLSENNLSGSIPPEVAGLQGITRNFDLSRNSLNGEVPLEIEGLQMAQYINLSSNQLSGNVTFYIESWLDARQINLSFNKFGGSLPKSIGKSLTQLETIDISDNNFTGSVPASLCNLSHLRFINFSYNNFDGEVACLNNSSKFPRISRLSFLGNPNLCGRCFGFRPCQQSPEQHRPFFSKTLILEIVLGILGGLLLLVLAGIFIFLRRMKGLEDTTMPGLSENFSNLSVEEIRRATDYFSASNLVGEGAYGKVYKGVLSTGETVAIKCFSCRNQTKAVKSFAKECRTLGVVRHRNILKIHDVVLSKELIAIVMPFMSNSSLCALLHSRESNGRLTLLKLSLRLRILTELASGLSYLHHDCHYQIIHCDIKPQNVLLDDDLTVKLSDFGIAQIMEDFEGLSTSSSSIALKGTVGYIAPEYGSGKGPSLKGDVYSFGIVVLEAITRLKPTYEIVSEDITLPRWISMALQGKSGEERRQMLKLIIMTADEGGGGIEIDNEEEMAAVESLLMLGLKCTCQDARKRPTMEEVESILHLISVRYMHNHRAVAGNLEEEVIERIVESLSTFHPNGKVEIECH